RAGVVLGRGGGGDRRGAGGGPVVVEGQRRRGRAGVAGRIRCRGGEGVVGAVAQRQVVDVPMAAGVGRGRADLRRAVVQGHRPAGLRRAVAVDRAGVVLGRGGGGDRRGAGGGPVVVEGQRRRGRAGVAGRIRRRGGEGVVGAVAQRQDRKSAVEGEGVRGGGGRRRAGEQGHR